MHLLDQVLQDGAGIRIAMHGDGDDYRLPGPNVLAQALCDCPLRYVLNDDVTSLCTQLAFESSTIIGSSLEILRIPVPALWLEFAGGARDEALANVERACAPEARGSGQRIGLLVSGEERRGTIDACWEGGTGVELAPFRIEYDLDDPDFLRAADGDGCMGIAVPSFPALGALFDHMRFRLRPQWHRYYRERARSDAHYRETLMAALYPQLEDVPFFAMFCLLLMSKTALTPTPCERSKLNKVRRRRGRQPLLDHVLLSMNLLTPEEPPPREALHVDRTAPRLHFVRGHLVRRGADVHWRRSHMRGTAAIGSIRSRTVSLRLASG